MILQDVYSADTPFSLLKLFTVHPIVTKHAFFSNPAQVCFSKISLELNVKDTYYVTGYEKHPGILDVGNAGDITGRYGGFKEFLNKGMEESFPIDCVGETSSKREVKVTMIKVRQQRG